MQGAEERSRAALLLALSGLVVVAVVLVLVALLPRGARGAVYLVGLFGAAAMSLTGGVRCLGALLNTADHRGAAAVGAIVGLTIGVTLALLALLGGLSLLN